MRIRGSRPGLRRSPACPFFRPLPGKRPPGAISTDTAREALEILRDGSTFEWSTVTLLGFAIYVYAVEVERRRWDIVLAGLAFWLMDWFNELVNSAVLHVTDRAPLWTVTGDTSYLILIGLNVEISLLFLVSGVVFVKQLPADRSLRILGVPNRLFLVLAFSCLCVGIELVLNAIGVFHWEYWWWNTPFVPLIVVFGYMTFFGIAAWVYDMGADRSRQLRVVTVLAAIDVALGVGLGVAGWLWTGYSRRACKGRRHCRGPCVDARAGGARPGSRPADRRRRGRAELPVVGGEHRRRSRSGAGGARSGHPGDLGPGARRPPTRAGGASHRHRDLQPSLRVRDTQRAGSTA